VFDIGKFIKEHLPHGLYGISEDGNLNQNEDDDSDDSDEE
jgi:hypothetical protein